MLKVTIARRGGQVPLVTLKGRFDAGIAEILSDKLQATLGRDVVFDCAGIEAITSIGMREWLKYLKVLAASATFEFINCSLPFVEYCNLLPSSSFANCMVSLQVPYECDHCRAVHVDVHEVDGLRDVEEFDPIRCPKCNGIMNSKISSFLHLGFLNPE